MRRYVIEGVVLAAVFVALEVLGWVLRGQSATWFILRNAGTVLWQLVVLTKGGILLGLVALWWVGRKKGAPAAAGPAVPHCPTCGKARCYGGC